MKISAITVCRNAEATISRTITSFFSQDYHHKERVLIDGESTHRTLAIAESFQSPLTRIASEPDRGTCDAINKALWPYEGDAVCGDRDFHDAEGRVFPRWHGTSRPRRGFALGWMPAHPTFYVRRHIAEVVGAFDLSLPSAADYIWMLRAIEVHGACLQHIPHVPADMAPGGRSMRSLAAHLRHNLEALLAGRRWLNADFFDWALAAKPASKVTQLEKIRGASQ